MISQTDLLNEALAQLGKEVAINAILARKNAELEATLAKRNAEELLEQLTGDELQGIVGDDKG